MPAALKYVNIFYVNCLWCDALTVISQQKLNVSVTKRFFCCRDHRYNWISNHVSEINRQRTPPKTFVTVTCHWCNVKFNVESKYYAQKMKLSDKIFCPGDSTGHSQCFRQYMISTRKGKPGKPQIFVVPIVYRNCGWCGDPVVVSEKYHNKYPNKITLHKTKECLGGFRGSLLEQRIKEGKMDWQKDLPPDHPKLIERNKKLSKTRRKNLYAEKTEWPSKPGKTKYVQYDSPIAGNVVLQGKLEERMANILDVIGVQWSRPKGGVIQYNIGDGLRMYTPDFETDYYYIETKGEHILERDLPKVNVSRLICNKPIYIITTKMMNQLEKNPDDLFRVIYDYSHIN